MSTTSDDSGKRVLAAALTLFGRHGFQRTSMADIAREAGIARATLYLHFSDKRAVFEALAASLVDDALTSAGLAWEVDAPLSYNIRETILAKEMPFFLILNTTPHGREMLEHGAEMTASHVRRLDDGFAALLLQRARDAQVGGVNLTAFGDATGFAAFLATVGASLKHQARTEEAFRAVVDRLARVSAQAAGRS